MAALAIAFGCGASTLRQMRHELGGRSDRGPRGHTPAGGRRADRRADLAERIARVREAKIRVGECTARQAGIDGRGVGRGTTAVIRVPDEVIDELILDLRREVYAQDLAAPGCRLAVLLAQAEQIIEVLHPCPEAARPARPRRISAAGD